MMQRQFEDEIDVIKESILTMAGMAERALTDAGRALVERDSDLAMKVIAGDDKIDQMEVEVDRLATEFIVRHQPAAADLRFVVTAIKLGPELERIADHATNIAERALSLNKKPLLKPLIDVPRMLNLARAMVSDAIESYVKRDPVLARQIITRDDEVDQLYVQILRELITFMIEDPQTIARAIGLIFVSRYAERVADQATNIAEEVVYLVEGEPIRHQQLEEE
jgi:phosphate transport system protein